MQSALLQEGTGGQTIGYLRINYFSRVGTEAIAKAVSEMEEQGVGGYILDVRNCLGGLLKEALFTASMFQEEVPGGSSRVSGKGVYAAAQKCRVSTGCVSFEDRNIADEPLDLKERMAFAGGAGADRGGGDVGAGNQKSRTVKSLTLLNIMDASGLVRAETLDDQRDLDRWPSTGGHPREHAVSRSKPMEVLTNRGSASASEVLAMALASNSRAHIIGERTFGKALIQHPYRLADGSILTLTVAEYLSPGPRIRHLGAGLFPQSPCYSSPNVPTHFERNIAKSAVPDTCIDAGEKSISATLGWVGGEVGGRKERTWEAKVAETPKKLVDATGRKGNGMRVPPALMTAVSLNNIPPPSFTPQAAATSVTVGQDQQQLQQ